MLTISQIFANTGSITRSKSEIILREIRVSSVKAIADGTACSWIRVDDEADGVYLAYGEFVDLAETFADAYSILGEFPQLLTAPVIERLNAVVGDAAARRVIARAYVEMRRQELQKRAETDREAKRRQLLEKRRAEYLSYLASEEWAERRQEVLRRDRWTCQDCGDPDAILDVHHRTYAHFGCEPLEDLTSLCRDCHDKAHGAPSALNRIF